MKTVFVALDTRSYDVVIGAGSLADHSRWQALLSGRRALIVTDTTVAGLYGDRLRDAIGGNTGLHALPAGESHKTLATAAAIWDRLMEARLARDDLLIALGGGVVGDITGFAAACYQRGIEYIQVPTTLIAQVDSAIGGKTGVNHPLGKNMIGAFHQPAAVVADVATLATLPEAEFRAGLAEVIKYGIIADANFFAWLERHIDALLARDEATLVHAIARSCEIKAAIVAADEHEMGKRALLNLGHTFGHAIETGLGHGRWRHGEAVAVGTVLAADFSVRIGWLCEADRQRIVELIKHVGLPICTPAELDADRMLALMAGDKKVRGGRLRLVLPQAIGVADIVADFDQQALQETLTSKVPM